jgi:hypothetical protein
MCKEIKRLTELSNCRHLSKTDRDACTWAIQQIEPPIVAPDKGFNGFDFSKWPEIPDQALFTEYIKARKFKHKLIMTKAWVDSAENQMKILAQKNIGVNVAITIATKHGWQGLMAKWVINAIEEESEPAGDEEITNQNIKAKIKSGNVTHITQIPKDVRDDLVSALRFDRIKNEKYRVALINIGFSGD